MKKRIAAVLIMLCAAVMVFTSCGSPKTLEDYVNKHSDVKKELEQIASSSGMEITVKDNTVTYKYALTTSVPDDNVSIYRSSYEKSFSSYRSQFAGYVKQVEDESGIDGVDFKILVTDKDGKELYSQSITSSDN